MKMGKQENKSRESERAYSVIITAYVVCAGALILHLCCVYEWKYMQLLIFCGCVHAYAHFFGTIHT
uniref:Uncharacterized protein n=1 Tax=Anguilla anguilla TaxID=7936 RepID=A0A0E9X5C0_ANGAN